MGFWSEGTLEVKGEEDEDGAEVRGVMVRKGSKSQD